MLEMVTAFEKASGKVLSMLKHLYHLYIILYLQYMVFLWSERAFYLITVSVNQVSWFI